MSYLERLRGGDSEKRPPSVLQELQKGPADSGKRPPPALQELQKAPSYSFCSSHGAHFQKSDPAAPCEHCGCGSYWHAADGWHCEACTPAPAGVTRWLHVSGGRPAPLPPPALPWPAELTAALKRVSVHFEWTRADIADFCRWARRSPQALADAGEFLRTECAKLTEHQP